MAEPKTYHSIATFLLNALFFAELLYICFKFTTYNCMCQRALLCFSSISSLDHSKC